jgi:hypothetical protein
MQHNQAEMELELTSNNPCSDATKKQGRPKHSDGAVTPDALRKREYRDKIKTNSRPAPSINYDAVRKRKHREVTKAVADINHLQPTTIAVLVANNCLPDQLKPTGDDANSVAAMKELYTTKWVGGSHIKPQMTRHLSEHNVISEPNVK